MACIAQRRRAKRRKSKLRVPLAEQEKGWWLRSVVMVLRGLNKKRAASADPALLCTRNMCENLSRHA
jgi:hypothetical protein